MSNFLKNIILLIPIIFCLRCTPKNPPRVLTGLDVLLKSQISELRGKSIGIITNHTALTANGIHIVDTLINLPDVKIVRLFGPEHGIRGDVDRGKQIDNSIDKKTGLPVISLYGRNSKPTMESLKGIDLLLFDIQDVGVRFYSYTITLRNSLEAAKEKGIPILVLDRPNPINGITISGPILEDTLESAVGISGLPIRYGMTIGELARFFNLEIEAELKVIHLENWHRNYYYDNCNLKWIAPSPNMTDLQTALVYPGLCLLEGTNISEGRGTDEPFLIFGAPFIDPQKLLQNLTSPNGITLTEIKFTPKVIPGKAEYPKYKNEICRGLKISIIDRKRFEPIEFTTHLFALLQNLYPDKLKLNERFLTLLYGNESLLNYIRNKDTDSSTLSDNPALKNQFLAKRQKVLLYK